MFTACWYIVFEIWYSSPVVRLVVGKSGEWEVGSKGGVVKGEKKKKKTKWIEEIDRESGSRVSTEKRSFVFRPSFRSFARSSVYLSVVCFFFSSHKAELATYLWKKFLAWCELFLKSMKQSKLFLILRTKLDMMPDPLKMVGSWANRATWIA